MAYHIKNIKDRNIFLIVPFDDSSVLIQKPYRFLIEPAFFKHFDVTPIHTTEKLMVIFLCHHNLHYKEDHALPLMLQSVDLSYLVSPNYKEGNLPLMLIQDSAIQEFRQKLSPICSRKFSHSLTNQK